MVLARKSSMSWSGGARGSGRRPSGQGLWLSRRPTKERMRGPLDVYVSFNQKSRFWERAYRGQTTVATVAPIWIKSAMLTPKMAHRRCQDRVWSITLTNLTLRGRPFSSLDKTMEPSAPPLSPVFFDQPAASWKANRVAPRASALHWPLGWRKVLSISRAMYDQTQQ